MEERTIDLKTTSFPQKGVLAHLLSPLELQTFLDDFWGKVPLHLRSTNDKFSSLYSFDRFSEGLKALGQLLQRDTSQGRPRNARGPSVHASFSHGRDQILVNPADSLQLYNAGATLCAEGLESVDLALMSLALAAKREIQFAGNVSCRVYASPDGQGFDMHYDARIATTLQIEGRKRWRYSREVALPWPHYQVNMDILEGRKNVQLQDWELFRHPDQCSFEEVVLEPGDVLCLPAGTWHAAEAVGHSLAINLTFAYPGGLWGSLSPELGKLLVRNPGWRTPVSPIPTGTSASGEIPEAARLYFSERIGELITLLSDLQHDKAAQLEWWSKFRG